MNKKCLLMSLQHKIMIKKRDTLFIRFFERSHFRSRPDVAHPPNIPDLSRRYPF